MFSTTGVVDVVLQGYDGSILRPAETNPINKANGVNFIYVN